MGVPGRGRRRRRRRRRRAAAAAAAARGGVEQIVDALVIDLEDGCFDHEASAARARQEVRGGQGHEAGLVRVADHRVRLAARRLTVGQDGRRGAREHRRHHRRRDAGVELRRRRTGPKRSVKDPVGVQRLLAVRRLVDAEGAPVQRHRRLADAEDGALAAGALGVGERAHARTQETMRSCAARPPRTRPSGGGAARRTRPSGGAARPVAGMNACDASLERAAVACLTGATLC